MVPWPVSRLSSSYYEGRDPNDSAGPPRAIADELRPREVEIRVKSPAPGTDPPALHDEQLGTQARERAAEVLDQKDRVVRAAQGEAMQEAAAPAQERATKRQQGIAWLGWLVARGWRFTVDVVLPAAERIVKVYKDIHGETRATSEACYQLNWSCRRVEEGFTRPPHVAASIVENKARGPNVAGHRESKAPGIGARDERSLADVFRRWGHAPR
jgi:hypothetical protein